MEKILQIVKNLGMIYGIKSIYILLLKTFNAKYSTLRSCCFYIKNTNF